MRFVESKCPEEKAWYLDNTTYTFAEDSPYYGWRGGGNLSATAPTLDENGNVVSAGNDPTQDCNLPHLPTASPSPAVPAPSSVPSSAPSTEPSPSATPTPVPSPSLPPDLEE